MRKLSPTMEEGQLARWLKKEGDKVTMGEPLAEVDTDKATMEMQALSNGVLRKILINEGESAPLGQPIAIIGEADEDISALLKSVESKPASEPSKPAAPKAEAPASTEKEAAVPKGAASVDSKHPVETPRDDGRQLISPIAARMATEAGVSLQSIRGSGPGGRIVKRDIEDAVAAKASPAKAAPRLRPITTGEHKPGAVYEPSAYRDEPVSQMRQTIARRLVTSLGPVPHFFLTSEIDMERAADLKRSLNEIYPDIKVSVNDIIIKVTAAGLMQHPEVNASFQ